jgi:hypothetical protein
MIGCFLLLQVSLLTEGIAKQTLQHQEILLRAATQCIQQAAEGGLFNNVDVAALGEQFPILASNPVAAADRKVLMKFFLQVMLYQPPVLRGPTNALQAAQQPQPVQVHGSTPAGLSRRATAAVEGKSQLTGALGALCAP